MNELLRKRMAATQQASEQQTGDAAYERIFQMPVQRTETQFCDVPVDKLRPFFTADIGFHPYPRAKLEAFAEELKENGLYERILVRPSQERMNLKFWLDTTAQRRQSWQAGRIFPQRSWPSTTSEPSALRLQQIFCGGRI